MSIIQLTKTTPPSTPSSGQSSIYIDITDNRLKQKHDDGSTHIIDSKLITHTSDATLEVNTTNLISATTRLNLTLPTTMSVNDEINIIDIGGYGYKIKPNTGQTLKYYNVTTVTGGCSNSFMQSKSGFSNIKLVCTSANTTWEAVKIYDVYAGKGYMMGGQGVESSYTRTATIKDIDFSFETSNLISATLDTAKESGTGVNSNIKGYFMAGETAAGSTTTAVIEDMNFVTETSDVITATLDTSRYILAGASSSNKGYAIAGHANDSLPDLSSIEDLNFSTETSTTISATTSGTLSNNAGISGTLKGYTVGGDTTGGGTATKLVNALTYSTEAISNLGDVLSVARGTHGTLQSRTDGYVWSGYNWSTSLTSIDKINFNTETASLLTATTSFGVLYPCGVSAITKGYASGGVKSSDWSVINIIDCLNFLTDEKCTISATLSAKTYAATGVQGCI